MSAERTDSVAGSEIAYDVAPVPAAAPGWNSSEAAVAGGVVADGAAVIADPAVEPEAGREIITTGDVSIRADDPARAANDVVRIAETAGGRVDSRSEERPTETFGGFAFLTLRIPAGRVNSVIDEMSAAGDVTNVSISREDVTARGADLAARIAALETSTARLQELLGNAANTRDLLDVERELANRQADLDGLRAQRAALTDQVTMSTLNVNISASANAPRLVPRGFTGGLATGWHSLASFFRGLTVVLGAALPWLLLLGALAFVGRLLWKRLPWKRLRRKRPAPVVELVEATAG